MDTLTIIMIIQGAITLVLIINVIVQQDRIDQAAGYAKRLERGITRLEQELDAQKRQAAFKSIKK